MTIMKTLLLMILMHCLDDFFIQTHVLSELKQKKFWEKYGDTYKNDWIPALIIHSLEWSIMISLPLFFCSVDDFYIFIGVILNTAIHAFVDHLKCNKFKINLCVDQSIHLVQIILTYLILI